MCDPCLTPPLRLSGIVEESIVDGPGLRFVLFTQGCPHHCKGCHNPQTHSFSGGFLLRAEDVLTRMQEDPLLAGVTFSGGEPFEQAQALCAVAQGVRRMGLDVVTFTGYTYEALLRRADSWTDRLLALTDLLIDGPYVESLRDPELRFRGSSNQRELDRAARERLRLRMAS
ncbi:MAG: anaerobic ribonucleoside-triphosphate reductase activating protein [Desulfovibrio sp.]|nr:anaerobic ribonucleoside-triphosphate reductase activating protein [Desulfovibrio sp.]